MKGMFWLNYNENRSSNYLYNFSIPFDEGISLGTSALESIYGVWFPSSTQAFKPSYLKITDKLICLHLILKCKNVLFVISFLPLQSLAQESSLESLWDLLQQSLWPDRLLYLVRLKQGTQRLLNCTFPHPFIGILGKENFRAEWQMIKLKSVTSI